MLSTIATWYVVHNPTSLCEQVTLSSFCNRKWLARCIPEKLYACDNFHVSIALETNIYCFFPEHAILTIVNNHSQLICFTIAVTTTKCTGVFTESLYFCRCGGFQSLFWNVFTVSYVNSSTVVVLIPNKSKPIP